MNNLAQRFCIGLKHSAGYKAGQLTGIVIAVCACLGLLWPLVAYANTTLTVTEIRDELQQDGDCSLREAVQSVNTGVQFDNCGPGAHNDPLPPGPYIIGLTSSDYALSLAGASEDNNNTGDLDLRASVTIQGAGAALTRINGGAIDRVLDIDPSAVATITVTLSDLTIENGLAPAGADGGGIRNQDDTLHVRYAIINDNTIQLGTEAGQIGSGGGIANVGGTVHITGAVISNNRLVNGSGGGIYNYLGGTMTITNSTISGNRAAIASGTSSGGGISNVFSGGGGFNGGIDIVNSTITNNESDSVGGGISNFSSTMNIANSTISGNRADSSGGGIRNTGALSMTHVTITGNTADFNGDDIGDGGGIRSQTGNTVLKAVIMANNIDNSPQGGSIMPDGRGDFTSAGYNIIGNLTGITGISHMVNNDRVGLDPLLGALTGSPAYFPLQSASPALDQVPAADCTFISGGNNLLFNNGGPVTFAQNGAFRPSNSKCDIGAFEGSERIFLPLVLKVT